MVKPVKSKNKSKANLNKNTQNPKENQEKTADKGIQEQSEHTAENKQPESKDNVQNKNKLTRLCNFFKKLWNGDVQEKNKNSKKAEENAAKNNAATQQEEIKQAETVEQPEEQRKLSDYLEIISKLLGFSAILGTFIGGFFIYDYLKIIDQLSIFPEVITNPPALIATATIFGGIVLFLYFKFFVAFLLGINAKSGQGWNILKPIVSFSIFYIFSCVLDYHFLYPLISDTLTFISFLLFIFTTCSTACMLGFDKDYKRNIKIFIFLFLTHAYVIFLHLIPSNKLSLNSVHFARFAETPENSSWYLLHNNFQQNNGFQETSGIDRNDLFKLKQKFKCSALSEKEKVKKGISCSSIPEQRNNALYGYMAWNLGDTKVFCPPTAENNKGKKEAAKLATECIVISGKFLQILNKNYIDIMPKER